MKPCFGQVRDDLSEHDSLICCKETGNVFEDEDRRTDVVGELERVPEEVPAEVVPSESLTSDREGLAGETAGDNVHPSNESNAVCPFDCGCDVIVLGNLRPVALEYGTRMLIQLYLSNTFPTSLLESQIHTTDTRKC